MYIQLQKLYLFLQHKTFQNHFLKSIFMKKLFLILFFCFQAFFVFGQSPATWQQTSIDSVQKIADNLALTKGKYDTTYARAVYQVAMLHQKFANYSEAETIFYELLEIYTAKGSNMKGQRTMNYLETQISLADLYFLTERYNEATEIYKETINLSQLLLPEYADKYIYQLFQLLVANQKIGLHTEVDKKMAEIEKIYKNNKLQSRIDFLAVILKKAEIMTEDRLFYDAIEILELHLNKLNKNQFAAHKNYAAQPLSQKLRAAIGKNYTLLNKPAKAQSFYEPITKEKVADENLYQEVYINLGLSLQKQKKFQEANIIFENNKNHCTKKFGNDTPQAAFALTYLADLYATQDKYSKAEEIYKQAIAILKDKHNDKAAEYATICFKLAELYEEMYLFQSAVPLYAECLKQRVAELGEEHPDYLATLNRLARVYQRLQLYEKAEPYFREYILALNNEIIKKFPSMNNAEKATFYESMKPNLENFMRYCVDRAGLNPFQTTPSFKQSQEILGDLYDLQLATKAILLSANSKVRQQILSSKDTMLVNQYKRWSACREQVAQLSLVKKNDLAKLGIDLDSLKRETNGLEKQLSLLSTDFAQNFTNQKLSTWREVQKKLQTGEAAVEIIQIPYKKDTTFYVALILKAETQMHPEVAFFKQGAEMDNRFLKNYKNSIKYKIPDKTSYLNYWKPIAEKLENISKIYISPDAAYHQISLQTLLNPQTDKFLLEEKNITLLTNTKDILTIAPKTLLANKTALLLGRPHYSLDQVLASNITQSRGGAMRELMRGAAFTDLVGTEKEIRYVDSVLRANEWKTKLFLGKDAGESAVKKLDSLWQNVSIQSPAILHIATHGFFVNSQDELSDPMLRSGIVLAGINNYLKDGNKWQNEDGILNASEAMLLNLSDTELVILSACETGLGEVQQGEGVYGLQRAFKLAGSKSLLMSLWKVDDLATSQLISIFYTQLVLGKTKTEAFQAAQLVLKEKYKNPFYWGAFVMVGE